VHLTFGQINGPAPELSRVASWWSSTDPRGSEVPVGGRTRKRNFDVTPSASRLTNSLRDIGYDFPSAVADIVDNSLSAGARRIEVVIEFDGPRSYVLIADDGVGMGDDRLTEALRFGSRREYTDCDLGRYGLGLKTASISQCRRLTVVSRKAPTRRRLVLRTLDLDHILSVDRWEVTDPPPDSICHKALEWLTDGPGTVVVWESLDRVLPDRRPEGGWARRRLDQLAVKAADYLGMVFHRFIEGEAGDSPVVITVNGEKVRPWNPFGFGEEHLKVLPEKVFEVAVGDSHGKVRYRPFVLPPRHRFSSLPEFERLSGPLKWNRQQGLYIYRADRMIQSGGWCGIRAADEHTKLARVALDFGTSLDPLFRISVSKMRVTLPLELRPLIERPVQELCQAAERAYRRETQAKSDRKGPQAEPEVEAVSPSPGSTSGRIASALMTAALEAGEHESFLRIMALLKEQSPDVACALGW